MADSSKRVTEINNACTPVLHYGFDAESTGQTGDLSPSGNIGSVHGASYAPGDSMVGGSFSFDGIDDFVDAGNSAALQIMSNFTLSAWIKPLALPGPQGIIVKSKGYPAQDRRAVEFYLERDGQLVGYFWRGTERYFSGTTATGLVHVGQWSHVVIQHVASLPEHQMRIYVNGKPVPLVFGYETVSSVPSVSAADEPWTIGSWAQGKWPFFGKIDEVRMFNDVLRSDEIGELYEKDQAPGNVIAILTDRASVSVPEGGASNFRVKLSAQPARDVRVAVSRSAGDADVAVGVGADLIFTTKTWDAYQAVILIAAEDDGDNANGTATITCSAFGVTNSLVQATEADDDYVLGVTALNGVVIKNPDAPFYESGSVVVLGAIPNSGYHFEKWSGAVSSTTNPVTQTISSNMNLTANFARNGLIASWIERLFR